MGTIHLLETNEEAWNIDGSSSDRVEGRSWISQWEEVTGLSRNMCAYAGCLGRADVGGHIWIKGRGVFIAPICSHCNYSENVSRMQGSKSYLRSGTVVITSAYTSDMRRAERRIAFRGLERCCEACVQDISNQPENHNFCAACFRSCGQQRNQQQGTAHSQLRQGRQCTDCHRSISDRPPNHTQCWQCFRTRGARVYSSHQMHARTCQDCGIDISTRPQSHSVCYRCYEENKDDFSDGSC
mmetsp:Transcript_63060/g.176369  ORF Transcript_63060/g.176369 Transcript_63060/m.176369 type:complete len:240 (+) Transcript_63060:356-1075(+)